MKTKRTFKSFIIAIILCAAVAVPALILTADKVGQEVCAKILALSGLSEGDVRLAIGGVERHPGKGFEVTGVAVEAGKKRIALISSATIRTSVADMYRIVKGRGDRSEISAEVESLKLDLDQASLDMLTETFSNSESDEKSDFKIPGVSLVLSSIEADIVLDGFELHTDEMGCALAARPGLDLTAAWFATDKLSFLLEGDLYEVSDIRLMADNNLDITFNAGSFSAEGLGIVNGIQCKASLDEDFGLLAGQVSVSHADLLLSDVQAGADNIEAATRLDNSLWDTNLKLGSASISVAGLSAEASGLSIQARTDVLKSGVASILAKSVSTGEIAQAFLQSADVTDVMAEVSFGDALASLSVTGGISAEASEGFPVTRLGASFSAQADADLQNKSLVKASVSINSARIPEIDLPIGVSAFYDTSDGGTLSAGFDLGGVLDGNVSYSLEKNSVSASADTNDFAISLLERYWMEYAPFISGISDSSTVINGHASVEAVLGDGIPDGHAVADLSVDGLRLAGSSQSASLDVDVSTEGGKIICDNFNLGAMNLSLGFKGFIGAGQKLPQGSFVLEDTKAKEHIIEADFSLDEGGTYRMNANILKCLVSTLTGTVDWTENRSINAQAVLVTDYGTYPMTVTTNSEDFTFNAHGDSFNIDGILDPNSLLSVEASLNGVPLHFNNNLVLGAYGQIYADYSFSQGDWNFNQRNFDIRLEEIADLRFNLDLTETSIVLSNVRAMSLKNTSLDYSGSVVLRYPSLGELVSAFMDNAYISLSFTDTASSTDVISGILSEGIFYADVVTNGDFPVSLSVMGGNSNGVFASGSVMDFSFDARLEDKILRFYNCKGGMFSLDFEDIDLSVDLQTYTVNASASLTNTMHNILGDVQQGGRFMFSGDVKPLLDSLLRPSTQAQPMQASLSIRDAYLAEGYRFADTDISLKYSNGLVTASGNLINGRVDLRNSYVDLDIDPRFLIGVHVSGFYGDQLDLVLKDLSLPMGMVNQFINFPMLGIGEATFTGDLMVSGLVTNPLFHGSLYCKSLDMTMMWVPDQVINVRNLCLLAEGSSFTIDPCYMVIRSINGSGFCEGDLSGSIVLDNLGLSSLSFTVQTRGDDSYAFWFPIKSPEMELDIHGDISGSLTFYVKGTDSGIISDVVLDNGLVDFRVENYPEWMANFANAAPISIDMEIEVGKNLEFAYPERDNAFINLTFDEGEKLSLKVDAATGTFEPGGSLKFKTGQVYYFKNDFFVTDGSLSITKPRFSQTGAIELNLDLTARMREYDADGNLIDINLILQDASLDNISPRFESSNNLSENEIIQILTQAVLPDSVGGFSASSVASIAATAAEALTRLGIIESNQRSSLPATVRSLLGLDIFSIKSAVLQNIIVYALPGSAADKNRDLLARYLNGTSVFAGKHISDDVFLRGSLLLKENRGGKASKPTGHFLSEDLDVSFELSLEWENPLGIFTITAQPQELSVFDFLDTIGFSITKTIQF